MLALPQDVLPTLCRRVYSFWRRNIRPLRPSLFTITETEEGNMTRRSGYDESNSPQWRYFLARESEIKHRRISHQNRDNNDDAIIEEAENLFRTPDGEIKRNRPGKKVRQQQQQKRRENNPKGESPQKFTKKGREILYSASPGRPLSLPHGGIKKND